MDRTEYLNRMNRACYALAHDNISIGPKDTVEYQGVRYFPYEYTMGCDGEGGYNHYAVLHDLKASSVIRVPLEQVKE